MPDELFVCPAMCQFFGGDQPAFDEDGWVNCRKGHHHHEDEGYCLSGQCPDYTPDKSEDMTLICADILDTLKSAGRPMTEGEIITNVRLQSESRRSKN